MAITVTKFHRADGHEGFCSVAGLDDVDIEIMPAEAGRTFCVETVMVEAHIEALTLTVRLQDGAGGTILGFQCDLSNTEDPKSVDLWPSCAVGTMGNMLNMNSTGVPTQAVAMVSGYILNI